MHDMTCIKSSVRNDVIMPKKNALLGAGAELVLNRKVFDAAKSVFKAI